MLERMMEELLDGIQEFEDKQITATKENNFKRECQLLGSLIMTNELQLADKIQIMIMHSINERKVSGDWEKSQHCAYL